MAISIEQLKRSLDSVTIRTLVLALAIYQSIEDWRIRESGTASICLPDSSRRVSSQSSSSSDSGTDALGSKMTKATKKGTRVLRKADASCNFVFELKQMMLLNFVLGLGIKMGSSRYDMSFAVIFSDCRQVARNTPVDALGVLGFLYCSFDLE